MTSGVFGTDTPSSICISGLLTILALEKMYFPGHAFYWFNGGVHYIGIQSFLFLLLGVSIYILSNLSFTAVDTPFSGNTDSTIFAIRTLADLSGAWVMLAFHMQNCEVYVRMEKENLNALLRMQEESYRISAESIDVVNRKYHDMKYQIALLKSNVPQEDKLAFLEEMEQEISAYEARCKTGNKALDVLLSAKTLQCQKEGITLTLVADGKELDFMTDSDVSVLFGNALDNAIESVSKILTPEKRLIHLAVSSQKAFVCEFPSVWINFPESLQ